MDGRFAFIPPGSPTAYRVPDTDTSMEAVPPNMDAYTRDVVSDQSRLSGARGLRNLKERGA